LLTKTLLPGSTLINSVQIGLGALPGADTALIAEPQRGRVGDSLDFDEATRLAHPNAHRWDYLLSVPELKSIVAFEPHPAKDSEINVVIAKKQMAVDFLRAHLPAGKRVAKWYWVTRGRVRFGTMERARRLLDQKGITFAGRQLKAL
jgi:hypothetical protein